MIYLDHAATTPVREEVAEAMLRCLTADGIYANPSSDHAPGRKAAAVVEQARERFAALIGARAKDVVWTSGATEANNLALLGAAEFYTQGGKRIALAKTEHKSVLDPCRQLATRGWQLDWLPTDEEGVLKAEAVQAALSDETALMACMLVNNETGVVQDVPAMAALCAKQQTLLHVDAAQALGKLPIRARQWDVAMMSFSAHKLGGPKGIGALYLRGKPPVRVRPLVFGGGHERGLRSGTLPVHQIVGMVRAAELAEREREQQLRQWAQWREQLWQALDQALPHIWRNGSLRQQSPHILSVSFAGVDGEALRADLDRLALSSGSACTSENAEPSYVLRALGRDDALADASLRFSFGHTTRLEDVAEAARLVVASVRRLRALSPQWEEAA